MGNQLVILFVIAFISVCIIQDIYDFIIDIYLTFKNKKNGK